MSAPPVPEPDEALAFFLDFDGVLVEIAPTPDSITVPAHLPKRLAALHRVSSGALALVSGRNIADLHRHLPGFAGAVAGSHGAELVVAGSQRVNTNETGTDIAALHEAARKAVADETRILVETKPHGVALHYRAAPDLESKVREAVAGLAAVFPGLAMQEAKMAWELRPQWATKDRAVARLMAAPPFAGRRPVYAGDDTTDEPALDWVAANGGIAIKIGSGPSIAAHRLDGPADLAGWLDATIAKRGGM